MMQLALQQWGFICNNIFISVTDEHLENRSTMDWSICCSNMSSRKHVEEGQPNPTPPLTLNSLQALHDKILGRKIWHVAL